MFFQIEFDCKEKAQLVARLPEVRNALLANVVEFRQYPDEKLLKAGDIYEGIWLEHNQDNLFLAELSPESAWASQQVFMKFQRDDGLLPFSMTCQGPPQFWHLQCVYPFTRCALEIALKTRSSRDELEKIYAAGSRYDDWITTYRNRAGTGLAEAYCEWDTGHDNAPRVTDGGIPQDCPNKNAAEMPDIPAMPILSVDLSAMLYGNRTALAELAAMLGMTAEKAKWERKAGFIRDAIMEYLYDPEDEFYYDRDRNGFRKYRTEHVTRLFLNGVLSQDEFDRVWERHFTIPGKGFHCEYPIPAVAIDDPHFVKDCPKNSWGSNTQGLTILRALLWMDNYGHRDDMDAILSRWLKSALKYKTQFPQEINPFSGEPVGDAGNYTPSLLIFMEAIKRLHLVE